MAVEVVVICDHCARVVEGAPTAGQARARVRRAGGRTRTRRQPEDLCAHCAKEADEHDGERIPHG